MEGRRRRSGIDQQSAGRRGLERARRAAAHGRVLLAAAFRGLSAHNGTHLAAGMAYYALLAVVPGVTVVAAIAGRVLDDPAARDDAIEYLLENVPLTEDRGRSDLETMLEGISANAGALGIVGLIGLLITASALVTAARRSVNVAFGSEHKRGAIRGKALDVALVVGLGLMMTGSFALTLVGRLGLEPGGAIGDVVTAVVDATGFALPLVLTAAVFAILYTVLPSHRPSLADVWPGVAFATVAYELLKRGFSIYLENFANYDAVYGSLGAVVAFLFFVYLASIVFVLGAEVAALWPAARSGELGPDSGEQQQRPLAVRARQGFLDLLRRSPAKAERERAEAPSTEDGADHDGDR